MMAGGPVENKRDLNLHMPIKFSADVLTAPAVRSRRRAFKVQGGVARGHDD